VVEESSESASNLGYCSLWRFAKVPELLIRGLESHSASEAADQDCDRHSGAANHWLSMADSRVNSDTLVTFHKLGLPGRDDDSKSPAGERRPLYIEHNKQQRSAV
jgi:hypothetical protein